MRLLRVRRRFGTDFVPIVVRWLHRILRFSELLGCESFTNVTDYTPRSITFATFAVYRDGFAM